MPCSMALISLRFSSASWARSGSSMATSSPNTAIVHRLLPSLAHASLVGQGCAREPTRRACCTGRGHCDAARGRPAPQLPSSRGLTTAMDGRRRKTVHTARRPEERPKDASHSSTFTECTAAMLTLPSFAGPTSARSVTRTVRMRFSVGTGVRKARIRRDAAGRCGGGLGGTGRWRLADCVKSSPGLTSLGSLRHFGCERLHYERVVEVVRDITGRGHALDERHEVVLSRPGTQYRVYVLEGGDDV